MSGDFLRTHLVTLLARQFFPPSWEFQFFFHRNPNETSKIAPNFDDPIVWSFRVRHRFARWYIFRPKNRNLGKFLRVLELKMLVYLMDILSTLKPFNIFYGHLGYFEVIWYIFPRFAIFYQKSLATLVRWRFCFKFF
jgi:hypothetical protein